MQSGITDEKSAKIKKINKYKQQEMKILRVGQNETRTERERRRSGSVYFYQNLNWNLSKAAS